MLLDKIPKKTGEKERKFGDLIGTATGAMDKMLDDFNEAVPNNKSTRFFN